MLRKGMGNSSDKPSKKTSLSKSHWKEEINNDLAKISNFKSVYKIYLALHEIYNSPPDGVSKEYWQDKVISALTAQPILNLPKVKQILYSGLISKKADRVIKRKGGYAGARKGSGNNAIANEHYFPRKYVCKQILESSQTLSYDEFVEIWWARLGVYHITTKKENSTLQAHIEKMLKKNKDFDPLNWEKIYSDCKIELIRDTRHSVLEEE